MPLTIPKNLQFSILGGSGIDRTGFITTEFLSQLRGQLGIRAYREMSDNDPIMGGLLFSITMLLRKVQWRVVPPKDLARDQRALDAVEFVEGVIKDMSHPFSEFIANTLSFCAYGFSVSEIVWKRRGGLDTNDPTRRSKFDDGRIGIRKISHRPQFTLWRWIIQDDGGVAGIEQTLPDQATVPIPIEKLLLFRTSSADGSPEGRSLLRNAYIPYLRKVAIENAEGRAAMRSAGVVELKIPADYMKADAGDDEKAVYAAYKTLAASLAQDRQGSVILPSDKDEHGNELFSFQYVSTDGRRPADMTAIIERMDKRILASVLADWILLGQQSVGSFALSNDKTDVFAQCLEALLIIIQDVLNRHLLPRLWMLNEFDPEIMPELRYGDIDRRSIDELASYVERLGRAGMPLFPDQELENKLREVADLPEPSPEVRERAERAAIAQTEQQVASAEGAIIANEEPTEEEEIEEEEIEEEEIEEEELTEKSFVEWLIDKARRRWPAGSPNGMGGKFMPASGMSRGAAGGKKRSKRPPSKRKIAARRRHAREERKLRRKAQENERRRAAEQEVHRLNARQAYRRALERASEQGASHAHRSAASSRLAREFGRQSNAPSGPVVRDRPRLAALQRYKPTRLDRATDRATRAVSRIRDKFSSLLRRR